MSFAGLLNASGLIQVATKVVDTTTNEITKTWTTHASGVRCRLDEAKGQEIRMANNVYVKATHILFMEYRTDINEHDYRIVVGGRTYNILLIKDASGMAHHLEILLEIIR